MTGNWRKRLKHASRLLAKALQKANAFLKAIIILAVVVWIFFTGIDSITSVFTGSADNGTRANVTLGIAVLLLTMNQVNQSYRSAGQQASARKHQRTAARLLRASEDAAEPSEASRLGIQSAAHAIAALHLLIEEPPESDAD